MRRRKFLIFSIAAFLTACSTSALKNQDLSILTVSVAASLQDVMKAIAEEYSKNTVNIKIAYNFGSSGSLQQQIQQGATVDVFISANPKQIITLREQNLLLANTEKTLVKNKIVLIAPQDRVGVSTIKELTSKQVSKIAIGEPESVPAGKYSKEFLTSFNLYKTLKNKFVFAKNVRQVLAYVETGNVDAGFVYATDAKLSDKVKVIATVPEETHSPIIYTVAVLKNSKYHDIAQDFWQFIFSKSAKILFNKYGFTVII
ncbi:MAG: molybdate ABC transporter substrate-binding protein [Moorea sp. SIO2B7]|nr:molybdate ABC transporter substrate-binding protein [Moorena sp. SIO2B7]